MIGKAAKPRTFKNLIMEFFPVKYRSQKNSWMTSDIFLDWFMKKFVPALKRFLKKEKSFIRRQFIYWIMYYHICQKVNLRSTVSERYFCLQMLVLLSSQWTKGWSKTSRGVIENDFCNFWLKEWSRWWRESYATFKMSEYENGKKISRTGPGPNFYIWFRAGQGSGRNFNFSFGSGRARTEFFSLLRAGPGRECSHAAGSGPGLKKPARADLYGTPFRFTLKGKTQQIREHKIVFCKI